MTFTHEVAGELAFAWTTEGGRILVYADKPPEFGDGDSGTIEGVPSTLALTQGTGGAGTLNVPRHDPGVFTVYFFNASTDAIGPGPATVHYWTYGHCP